MIHLHSFLSVFADPFNLAMRCFVRMRCEPAVGALPLGIESRSFTVGLHSSTFDSLATLTGYRGRKNTRPFVRFIRAQVYGSRLFQDLAMRFGVL